MNTYLEIKKKNNQVLNNAYLDCLKRKNKWISLKKSKPLPEHIFQLVNASVYGIIYPEREESGFDYVTIYL